MEPNHERSIVLRSETQMERTVSGKGRIVAAMVSEALLLAKDFALTESGESVQVLPPPTALGVYALDVSGDYVITAPTDAQIRQAVLDMVGDDDFVVLGPSNDLDNYMQAARDPRGELALEYQERDINHHFSAIGDVDSEQIIAALICYRNGDEYWRSALRWERIDL